MKSVVVYSRMWRSGTGLYAQGLARGIAESGHSVIFIAPAGAPDDPATTMLGVRRVMPPREYVERDAASKPARAWRSLRRVAAGLGALLMSRLSSRNIVVSIPEPLVFWLPVLALLRVSGARVVFVCHDPEPHAFRLPAALQALERAAHATSYRWASRVVVLSVAGKAALVDRFAIDPARIAIIPHGAFDEPWAGEIRGDRRLLVFGTIRRNKQVTVAMQAVAAVADTGVRLTVAGEADANDPAYLDECKAMAALLGDLVKLENGYIHDDRVSALLAESDALLLPYADFESQSGVAVLAGMAGRPVICARTGGIPDLIDAGLAAVIVAAPVGPSELADAIRLFLVTPADTWSKLSADGRRSLEQRLAWKRVGEQFGEIFA
jgi:glycosyltransferase involved in cell wall biosynthesis